MTPRHIQLTLGVLLAGVMAAPAVAAQPRRLSDPSPFGWIFNDDVAQQTSQQNGGGRTPQGAPASYPDRVDWTGASDCENPCGAIR